VGGEKANFGGVCAVVGEDVKKKKFVNVLQRFINTLEDKLRAER